MTVDQPYFRLKGSAIALIDWANIYSSQQKNGWKVDTRKLSAFLDAHPQIRRKAFFYGEDHNRPSSDFLALQQQRGFTVVSKPVKQIPVRMDASVFKGKIVQLQEDLQLLRDKNNIISQLLYRLDGALRNHAGNRPADDPAFMEVFDVIESIDRELRNTNASIGVLWSNIRKAIVRRKCDFDVEIAREILLNLDTYSSYILFSGDGDYAPIFDVLRERGKQAILVFPKGCRGREYEENPDRRHSMYLCSLENIRPYIEQTAT